MQAHSILGVSPSATLDEVKKAYKKLAMKHHPDRGGDPAKFKEIHEAYDCIVKGNKDTTIDVDFDEFMRSVFKDKRKQIIKPITLSFEQVYNGCEVIVAGQQIQLNPGIREGRYPLDQYILDIKLNPHSIFLRNNNDLLVNLDVEWYEALLGKDFQIAHLSGKILKFKIPPNSYTNQIIRLHKQGMPVTNNVKNFGDLYIKINVKKLNQKELTQPLIDAIIQEYSNKLSITKTIR
jgi:DnaJ-class molecular chaperone